MFHSILPEQEQLQRLQEENRDLHNQKAQLQEHMEEEQRAARTATTEKRELQDLAMQRGASEGNWETCAGAWRAYEVGDSRDGMEPELSIEGKQTWDFSIWAVAGWR